MTNAGSTWHSREIKDLKSLPYRKITSVKIREQIINCTLLIGFTRGTSLVKDKLSLIFRIKRLIGTKMFLLKLILPSRVWIKTKGKTHLSQHFSSSGGIYQAKCKDFILQQEFINQSKNVSFSKSLNLRMLINVHNMKLISTDSETESLTKENTPPNLRWFLRLKTGIQVQFLLEGTFCFFK